MSPRNELGRDPRLRGCTWGGRSNTRIRESGGTLLYGRRKFPRGLRPSLLAGLLPPSLFFLPWGPWQLGESPPGVHPSALRLFARLVSRRVVVTCRGASSHPPPAPSSSPLLHPPARFSLCAGPSSRFSRAAATMVTAPLAPRRGFSWRGFSRRGCAGGGGTAGSSIRPPLSRGTLFRS